MKAGEYLEPAALPNPDQLLPILASTLHQCAIKNCLPHLLHRYTRCSLIFPPPFLNFYEQAHYGCVESYWKRDNENDNDQLMFLLDMSFYAQSKHPIYVFAVRK